MKVTKLIKEYVAEQVAVKCPETKMEKRYKEKLDEMQLKAEELNEKVKNYALDLCEQANKDLDIDNWEKDDRFHLYGSYAHISSGYNNPYAKNLNFLKNKRKEKINEAVKNILINLELGATKAELDEMLKKLGEEG